MFDRSMPDGVHAKKMNIDRHCNWGGNLVKLKIRRDFIEQKNDKYPLTFNSFDDEDAKAVYELFKTGYLTGSITKEYESKLMKSLGAIMRSRKFRVKR